MNCEFQEFWPTAVVVELTHMQHISYFYGEFVKQLSDYERNHPD
jgi:hypothetical protein